MRNQLLFLLSCFMLFFSSCEKDDIIYIEGNQAPPDTTIENITKENYINKLYISILGRQATTVEFNAGLVILNQNNLSKNNREELVDAVHANEAYFHNEYRIIREDVINGIDTNEVPEYISIFEQTKAGTNDQAYIKIIDDYLAKLHLMKEIIPDLLSKTIDFSEVQKRCIYNHFYDEINMGTENFVVSLFQNFLFRYPTSAELTECSNMVDGVQSIVFFKIGQSKEDFIDIFFSNSEYFEGQVRVAYLRFLFREPTDIESTTLAASYKSSLDFKAMQKQILTSDEYVGI